MLKTYLPGTLIKEIRKRKGLRQHHILNMGFDTKDSQVTLSRVENLRQNPTKDTLADLLSKVDMPYPQFFCPYMENQPPAAFVLKQQIMYLLERAEGDEKAQAQAQELIAKLKDILDMDSLINKQLWISLTTELSTLAGHGEDLALIKEGLRLTYPEFDEESFDGAVLIFYESSLIINLARCYANQRHFDQAIKILQQAITGYKKLPQSEMHKEPLMGKMYNLRTKCLLEKGDLNAALEVAGEAMDICKKQSGSSQLPYAVYYKALASNDAALLRQAYFAFALLKMEAMQKQVHKAIQRIAAFETYGTEAFALPKNVFNFKYSGAEAVYHRPVIAAIPPNRRGQTGRNIRRHLFPQFLLHDRKRRKKAH